MCVHTSTTKHSGLYTSTTMCVHSPCTSLVPPLSNRMIISRNAKSHANEDPAIDIEATTLAVIFVLLYLYVCLLACVCARVCVCVCLCPRLLACSKGESTQLACSSLAAECCPLLRDEPGLCVACDARVLPTSTQSEYNRDICSTQHAVQHKPRHAHVHNCTASPCPNAIFASHQTPQRQSSITRVCGDEARSAMARVSAPNLSPLTHHASCHVSGGCECVQCQRQGLQLYWGRA